MSVRYRPIDGEKVSAQWLVVLRDMRRAGVVFNVNEGKRTMARQWYFYRLYLSGRGNLAAYPSSSAPHIRVGRIDHAIDFGNDAAVFAWLRRKGLSPVRTVSGESWHIECPASKLRAYARSHGRPDPYRRLPKVERRAVHKLLEHRAGARREAPGGKGPRYREHKKWAKHYRRLLTKQLRATRKAARAEKNGWDKYRRRTRYRLIRRALA